LPHAYVMGGESGYRISLLELLRTPFDCDTHFVQYVSDENVRLRKDMVTPGLRFEIMAVDLDGPGHQPPADDEWWDLVQTTSWMQPQPNAVYRTRAGARLIYLTDAFTDGAEFEVKRLKLLSIV